MNGTVKYNPYKSAALESFSLWYGNWHGYISIVICVIGILLNIINIIVLTRKKMQTPINCILTWLAAFDIATMMSYVPFAYHFYCHFSTFYISSEKNSKPWMTFLLFHVNFSATTHTVSIWLAVALAVFRNRHIHSPAKGSLTRMRRLIRARIVVYVIVCASVLIMIPNYIIHKLKKISLRDNTTVYVFDDWKLGSEQTKPLVMVALILYSVLAKLLPCFLIILYGGLLLRTLHETMKVKRRMSSGGTSLSYQRDRNHSRTTTMLLTVIVLFLVTELPQGILIVCSLFLDRFFENIYIPLGDAMDMLALVNNAINFVLYCTMSHEFRRTFISLFCSFTVFDQPVNPCTNSQTQSVSLKSYNQKQETCITMFSKPPSFKRDSTAFL